MSNDLDQSVDYSEAITELSLVDIVLKVNRDERMFVGVDLSKAPTFSTREVATLFFQRSPGWLRWRESGGFTKGPRSMGANGVEKSRPTRDQMLLDVEPKRNPKGTRMYSYLDIEKLAHNLCARNAIHVNRLMITLAILRLEAVGSATIAS